MHRYKADEKWWLHEAELIATTTEVQAEFTEEDIWTEAVTDFIAKRIANNAEHIGIPEVLRDCIGILIQDQTQKHANRISSILRKAGWTRKQVRIDDKRIWRYFSHGVTSVRDTGDVTGAG